MKYLKLYENFYSNTFVNLLRYYFDKNKNIKYYNNWNFKVFDSNNSGHYQWSKDNMIVSTRIYNTQTSIDIGIYYNYILYQKLEEKFDKIPENIEEIKQFSDKYFNEIMPKILYMVENKDKVIEFIRFLVNNKGVKDNYYNILEINDTINGDSIECLSCSGIYFMGDKPSMHGVEHIYKVLKFPPIPSVSFNNYPMEKLFVLYEYLKKKYPDMAVGKEWGFFDLKENKFYDDINERVKIIEFIKFVAEKKGGKDNTIVINDIIEGLDDRVIYISSRAIYYKNILMEFCSDMKLEKLKSIEEYLKKKYPELATGKEWGFFDLERSSK